LTLLKTSWAPLDAAAEAGWAVFAMIAEQDGFKVDARDQSDIKLAMRKAFFENLGPELRPTLLN
jgi:hypothetical protein